MVLLIHEPMTGYAIGKILNKPTANVYKALEVLAAEGAVMFEEGESRRCAAVPVSDFMRKMESRFLAQTQQTETALKSLERGHALDGVYQMQSAELVLERARQMLESCEQIAVLDLFPRPFQILRSAIEDAIARGIRLRLQVYEPVALDNAHTVVSPAHEMVLRVWPGQQVNMVIDGRETLLALLTHDLSGVLQAVWSRSLYLGFMVHLGLQHEQTMQQIISLRDTPEQQAALAAYLQTLSPLSDRDIPGLAELIGTKKTGQNA